MIATLLIHYRGCAMANTSAKDSHLTAEMESDLGLVPHQVNNLSSSSFCCRKTYTIQTCVFPIDTWISISLQYCSTCKSGLR